MQKTTRISEAADLLLSKLQKKLGKSKTLIIEEALNRFAREEFIAQANRAYAALKENDAAWQDELKERELWDATLQDGENE